MTEPTTPAPAPGRKWFAPPSGGYRGLSKVGLVVERPATPPSVRAVPLTGDHPAPRSTPETPAHNA